MNKIQAIISLFVFLVVLFSMDQLFGREPFANQKIGWDLNYKVSLPKETLNGNIIYSGKGFLADNVNYPEGDDQGLFFGFSKS